MATLAKKVVRFPAERVIHPVREGATRLQVLGGRVRAAVGRALNAAGVPGFIRPVEIKDELTGQHIAVSVGEYFLKVSIDGRDYYFNRLSGRLDGTGSAP